MKKNRAHQQKNRSRRIRERLRNFRANSESKPPSQKLEKTLEERADEGRMMPTRYEMIFMSRLARACITPFIHQQVIGFYIADFVLPRKMAVIEIDGRTHDSPKAKAYDEHRDDFLMRHGFKVVRIRNSDASSWSLEAIKHYSEHPFGEFEEAIESARDKACVKGPVRKQKQRRILDQRATETMAKADNSPRLVKKTEIDNAEWGICPGCNTPHPIFEGEIIPHEQPRGTALCSGQPEQRAREPLKKRKKKAPKIITVDPERAAFLQTFDDKIPF